MAEKLGYQETDGGLLMPAGEETNKTASVEDDALKVAFIGKVSATKQSEMTKDVVPSYFASKAVPMLTKEEKDLPKSVIDTLGASPLESALSTPTSLGIVLRPREFQRVILLQIGRRDLADRFDRQGLVFPKTDEADEVPMGPDAVSAILARLLSPFLGGRSGFGPFVEQRVVVLSKNPTEEPPKPTSHSSSLLRKIGSAYNGYRKNVMDLVAHSQELMMSEGMPSEGMKLANAKVADVFTPLSVSYLTDAFMDEVGTTDSTPSIVERGSPSRNTWDNQLKTGGQR
jgi:hypothetical protein